MMNTLPRKPKVGNKHSLTLRDIEALKVGNYELVGSPTFWWNEIISAWCITESCGSPFAGNDFWIGIYSQDAPEHSGKFRFWISCYGGMCNYNFNEFFNIKDIDCKDDLIIQEKFLKQINELIDKGILVKP